ncbi:MAG: transglutaminase-like domain-containing protein [Bacteroidota bacterium]|nr:transglutaminase-like domain-containing protein [Bacteroidota bacterium]
MSSENEILALIQLLDDPDSQVFQSVNQNLLSQGSEVIPILEKAWEASGDEFLQNRIENLIHEIHIESVIKELVLWKSSGATHLIDGAYLIAKLQYPDIRLEHIRSELDKIVKSVWLELNQNLTALEKIRILNHIFYEVLSFSGNQKNYYDPQNNFINSVLASKKGNPISLSIIYSIVAQKLELPVYGVNLPKNFILAYMDKDPSKPNSILKSVSSVLFYINPFRNGIVLNRTDIEKFVKGLNITPEPAFFKPCSNIHIIQRLISNLVFAFEKLGQIEKADMYKQVLKIVSEEDEEG